MPNNEQEAWAEILKTRKRAAAASTLDDKSEDDKNEKVCSQLALAQAELDYEIVITLAELKQIKNENL